MGGRHQLRWIEQCPNKSKQHGHVELRHAETNFVGPGLGVELMAASTQYNPPGQGCNRQTLHLFIMPRAGQSSTFLGCLPTSSTKGTMILAASSSRTRLEDDLPGKVRRFLRLGGR